jgi:hypothetical protein
MGYLYRQLGNTQLFLRPAHREQRCRHLFPCACWSTKHRARRSASGPESTEPAPTPGNDSRRPSVSGARGGPFLPASAGRHTSTSAMRRRPQGAANYTGPRLPPTSSRRAPLNFSWSTGQPRDPYRPGTGAIAHAGQCFWTGTAVVPPMRAEMRPPPKSHPRWPSGRSAAKASVHLLVEA